MGNSFDRYQFRETDLITTAIAAVLIGILLWLFFGKMGYRGKARWYLVLSAFFPPLLGINLLVLSFITWPVGAELKQLRKQVKELKPRG